MNHMHFLPKLHRDNILLILSIVIFAALVGVSFSPAEDTSAAAPPEVPFGGIITFTWYCTCSGGVAQHILQPAPHPPVVVMFQPGVTVTKRNFQYYRIGAYVRGNFAPGPQCLYFVGKGCLPYPVEGIVTVEGTSL